MDILITPFFDYPFSKWFKESICQLDLEAFGVNNSWDIDNFYKDLPLKKELSFIACQNTKITGYLIGSSYETSAGLTAHVNRIAVSSDNRNRGTGLKLLEYFENNAKKYCCRYITLEFENKIDVSRFYAKAGYMPVTRKADILNYLKAKNKDQLVDIYLNFDRNIYFKYITD
jgi:ribosomal protein S18 acetylase RimI-like enzyme